MIKPAQHTAFIGLGGNIGDPRATIRLALERLDSVPSVKVVTTSDLIQTKPVGPIPNQPDFINGAAKIQTGLTPLELLDTLLSIEAAFGRDRRTEKNKGPRTLDLDLLLYGDRIIRNRRLVVPHPELSNRRFVLEPLAQIAPDAILPSDGRTVRQLLDLLLQRKEDSAK